MSLALLLEQGSRSSYYLGFHGVVEREKTSALVAWFGLDGVEEFFAPRSGVGCLFLRRKLIIRGGSIVLAFLQCATVVNIRNLEFLFFSFWF